MAAMDRLDPAQPYAPGQRAGLYAPGQATGRISAAQQDPYRAAAPVDAYAAAIYQTNQIADPGPLGLAAFALTTFVGLLTTHGLQLHWPMEALLLAGMWEFKKNNTFGATAFTTYGGFWFSLSIFIILVLTRVIPEPNVPNMLGWILTGFFIFNTYMWFCSLLLSKAVMAVFTTLEITFIILMIGEFNHELAKHRWICAGGYAAFYASGAFCFNATAKRKVIPVGSPLIKFATRGGPPLAWAAKWRRLAVAVGLTLALLLLVRLWRALATPTAQYCVIIDSGSTGTRVYVYSWPRRWAASPLPKLRSVGGLSVPRQHGGAYQRKETEPGLDRYVGDSDGLRRTALGPLLDWAVDQVPAARRPSAPVFLFATAGLRRLPAGDSAQLLEEARKVIRSYPFRFCPSWARIISGVEEAKYGWIALNHGLGNLERARWLRAAPSEGSLDLGGSSLEVTFLPPDGELDDSDEDESNDSSAVVPVGFHSAVRRLSARSHTGFGLNDAFDRSVAILAKTSIRAAAAAARRRGPERRGSDAPNGGQDVEERTVVRHPCLQRGYNRLYTLVTKLPQAKEGPSQVLLQQQEEGALAANGESSLGPASLGQVELVGDPDWGRCLALTKQIAVALRGCSPQDAPINGDTFSASCQHKRAALARPLRGHFYALAGFYVVHNFYFGPRGNASGAARAGGALGTLDALLAAGREFCERPWPEVERSRQGERNVDRYCFRAPYTVALLRSGLGLGDRQLSIGSGDMSWTAGAALYEAATVKLGSPCASAETAARAGDITEPMATARGVDGMPLGGPQEEEDGSMLLVLVIVLVLLAGATLVRWWRARRPQAWSFSPINSIVVDDRNGVPSSLSRGIYDTQRGNWGTMRDSAPVLAGLVESEKRTWGGYRGSEDSSVPQPLQVRLQARRIPSRDELLLEP
eukprot:SM000117S25476  [mRNA]  locus=s117:82033:89194:- [translate_table: standard]